jgi:hypothetical protein
MPNLSKHDAGKGQALLLPQGKRAGPVGHSIEVAAHTLQQRAQLHKHGGRSGSGGRRLSRGGETRGHPRT